MPASIRTYSFHTRHILPSRDDTDGEANLGARVGTPEACCTLGVFDRRNAAWRRLSDARALVEGIETSSVSWYERSSWSNFQCSMFIYVYSI